MVDKNYVFCSLTLKMHDHDTFIQTLGNEHYLVVLSHTATNKF